MVIVTHRAAVASCVGEGVCWCPMLAIYLQCRLLVVFFLFVSHKVSFSLFRVAWLVWSHVRGRTWGPHVPPSVGAWGLGRAPQVARLHVAQTAERPKH